MFVSRSGRTNQRCRVERVVDYRYDANELGYETFPREEMVLFEGKWHPDRSRVQLYTALAWQQQCYPFACVSDIFLGDRTRRI